MIDFDINKVTFEEHVIIGDGHVLHDHATKEEHQHSMTNLFFIAPKEWSVYLHDKHCGSCIMVSFPTIHPTADYADVWISPIIKDEDGYTDAAWVELDIGSSLSEEEIQSLIDKAFEVIQKS